jgi:uncharacterized protein YqhQ
LAGPDDTPLRLGGMALGNGLLVHGPSAWAAAVRRADGTIATASGRKPRLRGRLADAPGARGVVRLAEAMAVIPIVKRALPEAQLPFADPRAVAGSAAASVAATALKRRLGGQRGDAAALALSIIPAVAALRIGDVAAYHGAEHKTIGAYEQGDDAAGAAKEHDRCGSHLVTPLLATQLAAVGASVEVFSWAERHADSRAARALRRPGHELQRLIGTREPTEEQLEVGRAALEAILAAEQAG